MGFFSKETLPDLDLVARVVQTRRLPRLEYGLQLLNSAGDKEQPGVYAESREISKPVDSKKIVTPTPEAIKAGYVNEGPVPKNVARGVVETAVHVSTQEEIAKAALLSEAQNLVKQALEDRAGTLQ